MKINPILIKEFSKATTLRRTKTDKKDAILIARHIQEKKYITYPHKSYHIASLKSLTRARDSLVRERALMLVKMTNALDKIFPEFKTFFNNSLKSSTALYLLKKYKCPSKMANMNSESYNKMSSTRRRTISYPRFVKLNELAKNTMGKYENNGQMVIHGSLYLHFVILNALKMFIIHNQVFHDYSHNPLYSYILNLF